MLLKTEKKSGMAEGGYTPLTQTETCLQSLMTGILPISRLFHLPIFELNWSSVVVARIIVTKMSLAAIIMDFHIMFKQFL